MATARSVSVQEISKHNTQSDLWIVVDGVVYDMTTFAPEHPGGLSIILRSAGRDATNSYSEIHAPSLIKETLDSSNIIGNLDAATVTTEWAKPPPSVSKTLNPDAKPPLDSLINTYDFYSAAERTLSAKTWAFYSSAATDLLTRDRNNAAYAEITLRPRVLINVKDVDSSTSMLGNAIKTPIFCAPAALAKLVHPEGEKDLARGCKSAGIAYGVSTNASFPLAEIMAAVNQGPNSIIPGGMPFFFQLYVDKQREKSEKLLKQVETLGVKGIFVTVDAPVAGKREADERVKADENAEGAPMSGAKIKNDKKGGGLGRVMAGYIDASLSWDDIPWLRKHTKVPIILKGITTAMDARKAVDYGIDAIILSNHGGRSLDTTPPPVLVLLELQKCCPEVFDNLEVYVDGGIMRGTDIFKALCLGAKAVGIGRGFLFALNYGKEGIEKYTEVLQDELETTMRLMGVTDLSQVHPGLLNTKAVDHLIPDGEEHPYARWRPKARI